MYKIAYCIWECCVKRNTLSLYHSHATGHWKLGIFDIQWSILMTSHERHGVWNQCNLIIYWTRYPDWKQRKHHSTALLALVSMPWWWNIEWNVSSQSLVCHNLTCITWDLSGRQRHFYRYLQPCYGTNVRPYMLQFSPTTGYWSCFVVPLILWTHIFIHFYKLYHFVFIFDWVPIYGLHRYSLATGPYMQKNFGRCIFLLMVRCVCMYWYYM